MFTWHNQTCKTFLLNAQSESGFLNFRLCSLQALGATGLTAIQIVKCKLLGKLCKE